LRGYGTNCRQGNWESHRRPRAATPGAVLKAKTEHNVADKGETKVSELGVIGYKSKFASEDVRLQLLKMRREYLIDTEQLQAALDAITVPPPPRSEARTGQRLRGRGVPHMRPPQRGHAAVRWLWCALVLLSTSPVLAHASDNLTTGATLFERGQFTAAQQFFEEFVNQYPTDASGPYYLGRLAYERQRYDQAISWLERAVQLDSSKADHHRWLGRAYGQQAQRAGGEAFFLARKVKPRLEKAVELDPSNIAARFDLMEFYLQAPLFLGGDPAKATAQAAEIAKRDAAAGRKAWQRCEQEARSTAPVQPTGPRRLHVSR